MGGEQAQYKLQQKLVHDMDPRKGFLGLVCLLLSFSPAINFVAQCEARSLRRSRSVIKRNRNKQVKAVVHLDGFTSSDPYSSNYIGSPDSLSPFDEVLGPSSPDINPPFCIYPPFTPLPPSTTMPTPTLPFVPPSPPPQPIYNNPPGIGPNPPEYPSPTPPEYTPLPPIIIPSPPEYAPTPPTTTPSPPEYTPTPPTITPSPSGYTPTPPTNEPSPPEYNPPVIMPNPPGYEPSPPGYVPSPPEYVPGPPEFVPGPPIFLPPVVYPPPSVPPPPYTGTTPALWCVAKPTVPDPIIQEAMNYACGSGANCDEIQPNGLCYQPDTLIAHASFAFNSYWQRTKVAGGTCDFGGTAILITKDPSYDGCHFTFY